MKHENICFSNLAERYLDSETIHGNRRSEAVTIITRRLIQRFGNLKLADVNWPVAIAEMVRELKVDGDIFAAKRRKYSNAYINIYITTLNAMFRLANDSFGYAKPLPRTKKLPEPGRELYLKPAQITALCDHLPPLRASMVRFAFHTGLRNTTVRLLKWDQVETTGSKTVIEFYGTQMKNSKPFAAPLNRHAVELLRERKTVTEELEGTVGGSIPWVFAQSGRRLQDCRPLGRTGMCNDVWKRAVAAAGLPANTTFHTLRHSMATHHVKNGTDSTELLAVGGWRSIASVTRYLHVDVDHQHTVLERVAERV